jgi:DNA polymerase I
MQTKNFILMDIDYVTRNRKPVIRLFGKLLENNEQKHIIVLDKHFKHYIYVIPHDIDVCLDELKKLNILKWKKIYKNDGELVKEVLKVIFNHPQDIPKFVEKARNLKSVKEIREYDIPFYRRYLIDKGLSPMNMVEVHGRILSENSSTCIFQAEKPPTPQKSSLPELKVLSFDMEIYNPQNTAKPGQNSIIIISFSSNQGFKKVFSTKKSGMNFVETVTNEKELLEKFVETIKSQNPDFILGYNSDNFDFPYIRDRAAKLGVTLKIGVDESELEFTQISGKNAAMIRGRIHIDLYPYIRRYLQLNHHTLKHAYKELFEVEKLDIPQEDIHTYWEEGKDKSDQLFRYSLDDAKSITQIGEKMLPLSIELTRIVGQPLFEVARMASGRHVEWYLIKKSFEYGNLVPNTALSSELARRKDIHVVGGYVKKPVQGLHENIVYFDFKSLYPSIIISKNISPDSLTHNTELDCHISPEYGHKFRKEPVGFIPSAIGKILQDRMRIKSLMKESIDKRQYQILDTEQKALKRLANTIYGLYNHDSFRWYSLECSEAITAWGRYFLKKTMEYAEKKGFKPVYADTDGFFATYK